MNTEFASRLNLDAMSSKPYVVFGEGDALYAAMLIDIANAQRIVRLESYIFSGDEVGWAFASALAARAQAGIAVLVNVDAAGALFQGTAKLFQYLLDAGVQARWFNRWRWRDPFHYNRRNHRKMLVVDDRCAYVGGFNIHRESSLAYAGKQRWRDVHIRFEGPPIEQATRVFDAAWTGHLLREPPPWAGPHRLVPNSTRACRRVLHCLYLDALTAARRAIVLVTPYFVPDRRFQAALVAASARGVDVRVLLPEKNDSRLVHWANHAMARRLGRKGVSFFEYRPRMMHAKAALIDGIWATIGSANADYRSFFVNRELNFVSRDPAVCRQLESLLNEDFEQSQPLRLSIKPPERLRGLAESLAHRVRRWL